MLNFFTLTLLVKSVFFRSVQVDEVINEKLLKKQGEVELLQKMRDSLEEDFTKLRDEACEKRKELAKHYQ